MGFDRKNAVPYGENTKLIAPVLTSSRTHYGWFNIVAMCVRTIIFAKCYLWLGAGGENRRRSRHSIKQIDFCYATGRCII